MDDDRDDYEIGKIEKVMAGLIVGAPLAYTIGHWLFSLVTTALKAL